MSTNPEQPLPELRITVFSDYICPFCYVGHHRLKRLRDSYDLKINWCFIEIHPETDASGEPTTSLDYSSEYWDELMANLKRVAAEESIPIAEHRLTTNSRDAIHLSEASKQLGRETFYELHEKLFHAFFVDARNIGDRAVLRDIAHGCGIEDDFMDRAWEDESVKQRILDNFDLVRRHEVQSVPSFIFGDRVLTGVVEEAALRAAAYDLSQK